MSKITFRADDDLVDAVEELDASKSEIMRDALRTYLATDRQPDAIGRRPVEESLDELVSRRVNEALDERLDEESGDDPTVNVYLEVDGSDVRSASVDRFVDDESESGASGFSAANTRHQKDGVEGRTCLQCGVDLASDHVYCPNCGEHAGRATLCECGTELDPRWSFCPECGRRTVSHELLDP